MGIFRYDIPLTGFGNVMVDDGGSMIRKGEVGEGKGKLTVKQQAVWDALNEEFFSKFPGMLEWLNEGGPLPALPAWCARHSCLLILISCKGIPVKQIFFHGVTTPSIKAVRPGFRQVL